MHFVKHLSTSIMNFNNTIFRGGGGGGGGEVSKGASSPPPTPCPLNETLSVISGEEGSYNTTSPVPSVISDEGGEAQAMAMCLKLSLVKEGTTLPLALGLQYLW